MSVKKAKVLVSLLKKADSSRGMQTLFVSGENVYVTNGNWGFKTNVTKSLGSKEGGYVSLVDLERACVGLKPNETVCLEVKEKDEDTRLSFDTVASVINEQLEPPKNSDNAELLGFNPGYVSDISKAFEQLLGSEESAAHGAVMRMTPTAMTFHAKTVFAVVMGIRQTKEKKK
jgi:hypothetical protein